MSLIASFLFLLAPRGSLIEGELEVVVAEELDPLGSALSFVFDAVRREVELGLESASTRVGVPVGRGVIPWRDHQRRPSVTGEEFEGCFARLTAS